MRRGERGRRRSRESERRRREQQTQQGRQPLINTTDAMTRGLQRERRSSQRRRSSADSAQKRRLTTPPTGNRTQQQQQQQQREPEKRTKTRATIMTKNAPAAAVNLQQAPRNYLKHWVFYTTAVRAVLDAVVQDDEKLRCNNQLRHKKGNHPTEELAASIDTLTKESEKHALPNEMPAIGEYTKRYRKLKTMLNVSQVSYLYHKQRQRQAMIFCCRRWRKWRTIRWR